MKNKTKKKNKNLFKNKKFWLIISSIALLYFIGGIVYINLDRDSGNVKNNKNLENARSMQRAFVKNLLIKNNCDGALVAFYTDGNLDKWRLSLVRLDYEFSKGKVFTITTPSELTTDAKCLNSTISMPM